MSLPTPLKLSDVKQVVAAYYGLSVKELEGPGRTRRIAHPRMIAYWLCRTRVIRFSRQVSFPDIGRAFGDRDHSTVVHGCNSVDAWRQEDAIVIDDIKFLNTRLDQLAGLTQGVMNASGDQAPRDGHRTGEVAGSDHPAAG